MRHAGIVVSVPRNIAGRDVVCSTRTEIRQIAHMDPPLEPRPQPRLQPHQERRSMYMCMIRITMTTLTYLVELEAAA